MKHKVIAGKCIRFGVHGHLAAAKRSDAGPAVAPYAQPTDVRSLGFGGYRRSLRKFETDFSFFQFQIGGEWSSAF